MHNATIKLVMWDRPGVHDNLLPLTFTRPVADLRVGITTLRCKWQLAIGVDTSSSMTVDYLQPKFGVDAEAGDVCLFVGGDILPDRGVVEAVMSLTRGQALVTGGEVIAYCGTLADMEAGFADERIDLSIPVRQIKWLYDIFGLNGDMIADDFAGLDVSDTLPLSPTNRVIGPMSDESGRRMIYIAPGAKVEGAIINTTGGPVYIGPDAEVMEGSCLRGPLALCEHSVINMGTKVYGSTTIGPWSKVGGELNNVVIIGYSNKAHDGFLGNAVIGEWCNLGAGCVASNLKNDYTPIKLWNYPAHRFLKTGLQFCGLIMGDHSKAGINTMFNTATVVGVGVNIHGSGFPRNFVASFSEGGASGFSDVQLTKFFDIAERVMARRHCQLTDVDRDIFIRIYNIADTYK